MQLEFPGTGSMLADKRWNWNNNLAIHQNSTVLAVDYGRDALHSFRDLGIQPTGVNGVFVTHLHPDHVGGIADIAIATKFAGLPKPYLFCEEHMMVELWEKVLRGALETLEGTTWLGNEDKVVNLGTYFQPVPLKQNASFKWEGVEFDIIQMVHTTDKYRNAPCYGLMWTDPDIHECILYTADVQFCPYKAMTAFYEEAHHIFHDCETTVGYKSGVHAHFDDLCTLPEKYKSKMHLMHSQDNVWSDLAAWQEKARSNGFRGFVPSGTTFSRTYLKLND